MILRVKHKRGILFSEPNIAGLARQMMIILLTRIIVGPKNLKILQVLLRFIVKSYKRKDILENYIFIIGLIFIIIHTLLSVLLMACNPSFSIITCTLFYASFPQRYATNAF